MTLQMMPRTPTIKSNTPIYNHSRIRWKEEEKENVLQEKKVHKYPSTPNRYPAWSAVKLVVVKSPNPTIPQLP